jgi:hypothetical protein
MNSLKILLTSAIVINCCSQFSNCEDVLAAEEDQFGKNFYTLVKNVPSLEKTTNLDRAFECIKSNKGKIATIFAVAGIAAVTTLSVFRGANTMPSSGLSIVSNGGFNGTDLCSKVGLAVRSVNDKVRNLICWGAKILAGGIIGWVFGVKLGNGQNAAVENHIDDVSGNKQPDEVLQYTATDQQELIKNQEDFPEVEPLVYTTRKDYPKVKPQF